MRRDDLKCGEPGPGLLPAIKLARDSLGIIGHEQCLRGELALSQKMGDLWSQRRPGRSRLLVSLAIIPALVVGTLMLRSAFVPKALSFRVENGLVGKSQVIEPTASAVPVLRFSDGSEVRLSEQAVARVRFVTPKGAAVALDRGQLHAEVVHSASSEWRFDAGPFSVRVTGTSFGLTWQPEQDRFDLRLEHGSVLVSSPVANDPIPVRAGQWLTIRSRNNEVLIRDLTADSVTSAPAPLSTLSEPLGDRALGASVPSQLLARDDARAKPSVSGEGSRSWVTDLAQGKLESILRDAQSRGLDECLAKVSSQELSALADAARYTRHNDIAQKALLAQRHRFAGSRKAVEAAFLLGKLAEAGQNETSAVGFFDTYLEEAPSGTYASEALGRKMAIVQHKSGSAAARPIARDYLSKFPQGTYAPAAEAILKNP